MLIYTAQRGDSVRTVAAKYGLPPETAASLNGLKTSSLLAEGQTLLLRFPKQSRRVKAGDSLSAIAAEYGVTLNALYRANPVLAGRPDIRAGQLLVISYADTPPYAFEAGGYAYPFIAEDILDTAAPFMDVLIPFTYGIRGDGSLYPLNDRRLLSAALRYGAAARMHLSTYTEGERFDSELASAVLSSPKAQQRLTEAVLENMKLKGYSGLDVDFEFLGAENAAPYAAFLSRLTAALNAEGFSVTAALAPKTNDSQSGALYEGHDYAAVADAVNAVLLMTYEWGYTYSAPMAVSPLPEVRRVVEYALTKMPPSKILLGISNYGYRWSLPHDPTSPQAAPSLSTAEAFETALNYGAAIKYDETAQSPYFVYNADGVRYEVWFEDARSLRARLELIPKYGLRGALYWNLDRRNTQNLSLLDALRK